MEYIFKFQRFEILYKLVYERFCSVDLFISLVCITTTERTTTTTTIITTTTDILTFGTDDNNKTFVVQATDPIPSGKQIVYFLIKLIISSPTLITKYINTVEAA